MGRITEESIQHVAAASDIVEVIGSYFPLKRAGSSWRALCPFHTEKSPSFHVNPARQSFHCFGCGAGGGVFRFVMDYENIDFPTAVNRLAQKAGIQVVEEAGGGHDDAVRNERSRLLELHREVAGWFQNNLLKRPEGAPARDYLKGRGLDREIALEWRIGYAPDAWTALSDWAEGKGFSPAELVRAGLAIAREDGSAYDRFRNRVMFPICNDFGEVIAFSGRTLGDDPAKYVNSPETPLFVKGRVLFGLDKTKRALIEAGEAIVFEGQIDLIRAFHAGIRHGIAPQGTAFTADQARTLKRYVSGIILCFDGDTAGQKAIERSLPALLACDLAVWVAPLPPGADPDSLIRDQGPEAFREIIAGARDFFDFALDVITARGDLETPRGRADAARRLAAHLALITNRALAEATAGRIAARLGISLAALAEMIPKKSSLREEPESGVAPVTEPLRLSPGLEFLCRLALADPVSRAWLADQSDPSPGEISEDFAPLERILASHVNASDPASWSTFLASLPKTWEAAIAGLDLTKLPTDPLSACVDGWRGVVRGHLRRRQDEAKARLQLPGLTPGQMMAAQKDLLDLQVRLKHIAEPFSLGQS